MSLEILDSASGLARAASGHPVVTPDVGGSVALPAYAARTHARPFATDDRWIGVRDPGGVLVAVGSAERTAGGAAYLSGITVTGRERGQGLGRAITAALPRQAVRHDGVCCPGVFADNTVAIGLYRDLGHRTSAQWVTRWA